MQRQSLGGSSSPGSKHHGVSSSSSSKEVVRLFDEDHEEESKDQETSPTTRKERSGVVVVSDIEQEKKKKKNKPEKHHHHHHLRSISRTEKSIHLIPILTIFCLLILYLCSYDPPLKDLAHIDGFRRISKRIDSTIEINSRFSSSELDHHQINKADVLLPIRSHRSLHEIRKDGKKSRFHRKIGDY